MRTDILGPATPAITATHSKALDSWQAGQILNALVVSTDNSRGIMTLKINEALIQAHGQMSATPGQLLKLQVTATGAQTVLKVVHSPPSEDPVIQALRVALPRQTELPPLFTHIAALAAPSPAGKTLLANIPQPIAQLVTQIFNNLTKAEQAMTVPGLKQALSNSGMFLENKLSNLASGNTNSSFPLSADFKAGLLLLREALTTHIPLVQPQEGSTTLRNTASPEQSASRNMPALTPATTLPSLTIEAIKNLAQQVEGGLARLQVNQLSSLPGAHSGVPLFTVELPLRRDDHIDLIQLRIEQDQTSRTTHPQERPWSVSLGFDIQELGPLYACITLLGAQVSVTLWAMEDGTATLVDQNIDRLKHNLTQAGLNIGGLRCQHGKPPHVTATNMPLEDAISLVDIRA